MGKAPDLVKSPSYWAGTRRGWGICWAAVWTCTYVHTPTQPQGPWASLPHGLSRSARFGQGQSSPGCCLPQWCPWALRTISSTWRRSCRRTTASGRNTRETAQGPEKPEEELEKDFAPRYPAMPAGHQWPCSCSMCPSVSEPTWLCQQRPGYTSWSCLVGCWAPDQPAWRE